jgi:biliverdin reductase
VLEYLFNGSPLYVKNTSSLYALKVAEAAARSSASGQTETVISS